MSIGSASASSLPASRRSLVGFAASLIRELRLIEGVRLWAKAPLTPFTTIGTGGKASLLVTVASTPALVAVLKMLAAAGSTWLCLGAGSNLLVADRGYPGVVVKLDDSFHYVEGLPSRPGPPSHPHTVTVGAGAYLARLAALVAEVGLAGLEFACGIPGSVGGGVAMNAGAHGWSLADLAEEVEVASALGVQWMPAAGLEWGYRFCHIPAGSVITAVQLGLTAGDPARILEHHRSLLRARRTTQPRGVRTFGSVFKNPPGDAAGRLLEVAGLKGVRRGGAEVSTVHANFVVNLGDATTADILALMSLMRQGVHRTTGILLEPEVRLLGTTFPWESVLDVAQGSLGTDG
ncbi:MAG: UDP-N-acetylmuramate dehydrogenase [bacterium]